MNPRVSLILPAYNAAAYLERWFERNVFTQTLRPFEVVMVNDGSTDSTELIAKEYTSKLEVQGIRFHYRYQINQGVGAAMDAALKLFNGDYLIWVDSDDFLSPDSIEKRVEFLEANPQYGYVRSDGFVFDNADLKVPKGLLSGNKKTRFNDRIFEDLLLEKTFCTPGCYMLRVSALLKILPTRSIYHSRVGQNWQILLPMSWHYSCGYIDEPLFNYVVYPDSISHHNKTMSDILVYMGRLEAVLLNVLPQIMGLDWNHYHQVITCKYARKRLSLAYEFKDFDLASESVSVLRSKKNLTKRDLLVLSRVRWPVLNYLARAIRKVLTPF